MRMVCCCLACTSFLSFLRVSVIYTPTATADARYSARALARLSTDSAVGYLHGHRPLYQAGPTDTERIEPRVAGLRAMQRVGGRDATFTRTLSCPNLFRPSREPGGGNRLVNNAALKLRY